MGSLTIISHFQYNGVRVFDNMFAFDNMGLYHPRSLGAIALVWIWFENGIDPKNSSCVWRFLHLDIPTKYEYLIDIICLRPMGRFIVTIIDVDYSYPCIHLHASPTLVCTSSACFALLNVSAVHQDNSPMMCIFHIDSPPGNWLTLKRQQLSFLDPCLFGSSCVLCGLLFCWLWLHDITSLLG